MNDMVITGFGEFTLVTEESSMYRPNYIPFAFLAMTAFAFSASRSFGWLPMELSVGSEPIPVGKSSRGNAAFRRSAAKKKQRRIARTRNK